MQDLFDLPVVRAAGLSPCGLYRYWLTRTWDATRPPATFVMLNPSTADAAKDDPTIRKCLYFATRWGCGSLRVVNLFAFRATDPAELERAADPIGPENDAAILAHAGRDLTVAAWGSHRFASERARHVAGLLAACGSRLHCLKLSKDGNPWHPLYVRGDTRPQPFTKG